MDKIFILNSSPIISLSKAGLNHILDTLTIRIPHDVVIELNHEKYADEARQCVNTHQECHFSEYRISDDIKNWGLGNGESSVLAVALQNRDWIAVLDDGAARKCANVYNLNLTGTLGLLLIAYKTGIIDNLHDAIDAVRQAGLHLNDNVIKDILQQADS